MVKFFFLEVWSCNGVVNGMVVTKYCVGWVLELWIWIPLVILCCSDYLCCLFFLGGSGIVMVVHY